MNIIATIRKFKVEKSVNETLTRVERLFNEGISNFRISLVDFDETTITTNMELCRLIKEKNENANFFLDLSFPYFKARIIETRNNQPFKVSAGERLSLYSRDSAVNSEKYLKVNLNELSNFDERIIYSDGEGFFNVVFKRSDKEYIIEAGNNINVFNRKSLITNGKLECKLRKDDLTLLYNYLERISIKNIMFSFVSDINDVEKCKKVFNNYNIISKIETYSAVNNIQSLSSVSNGIFLARGDLGLDVPVSEFVDCCDKVVKYVHKCNKPLIVGTDILDSLCRRNYPSRSDIVDLTRIMNYKPDYIVLNGALVTSPNLSCAINIINQFN